MPSVTPRRSPQSPRSEKAALEPLRDQMLAARAGQFMGFPGSCRWTLMLSGRRLPSSGTEARSLCLMVRPP
eukprot:5919870-Alexandrium_andersonii.AAC.1